MQTIGFLDQIGPLSVGTEKVCWRVVIKSYHNKGNLINFTVLHTGLMPRWYVFPRQIWHPRSLSWSTVIPFRVPWVPTGMKTGVLTALWGNVRSQTLAFVTGHSATIRRVSGEAADSAFLRDMLFSEGFVYSHSTAVAMLHCACDFLIGFAVVIDGNQSQRGKKYFDWRTYL